MRKSEAWKEKVELLEAVPGVGKVTIFTWRARLPELGRLNPSHSTQFSRH